jgi:hypothetical protein
MQSARLACLVVTLTGTSGCLGQGGDVTLTVSNVMGLSPAVSDYRASNATANSDDQGVIHFTAVSATGEQLTVQLQGPVKAGDMLSLMADHNLVSFDETGAGWSSNGGNVAVDGVAPYRLRFIAVPMIAGSGTAKGSFVFNGSGTFL